MTKPLRFFIAGIMQGSFRELTLYDQTYRTELCAILKKHFPDCSVYDPFAHHSNSITYDENKGRETFLMHNKMCGTEIDVLIAFIPEASMGTAIEMWEAYKNGAVIITITPLHLNWTVKFLSNAIFPNWNHFLAAIESGEIKKIVSKNK